MYGEIVLLLLLSGLFSIHEAMINKPHISLPVTSKNSGRPRRKVELPATEDPGLFSIHEAMINKPHISLPVTSKNSGRPRRKVELPATEDPGYVSTQEATSHEPEEMQTSHAAPTQVNIITIAYKNQTESSKGHLAHSLPGPVVAVITLVAIAGIVGIILFVTFLIRRTTRKKSFNLKNKDMSPH
ncbi:uncharacterized protein LOC141517828 isoform X4 [Macrotis lagotis]|uniref:uncharacterized protein LOC141517828 isoform X4 n=1 Tax=Macrotis lagotis TaxID=92651 RepID=UPI003D69885A